MFGSQVRGNAAGAGRLRDRLRSGKFVVTAEIVPPVSCEARDLIAKVEGLKGVADAVNVTDGAGARSHMGTLAAAALLIRSSVDPIMQLTCRDRNRIALQSDLLAAAAMGVENILLLTGDDPKAGDQPDAKPVFDLDSVTLTQIAARMRDRHELMSGQRISGTVDFFIGAADALIDPPPGWKPLRLKAKIDAGAQFVQSQFCMDAGVAARYARCLEDNGIGGLHLLVGICPLRSARSARWMREKLHGTIIPDPVVARLEGAADPVREGRKICAELVEALSENPDVAGVHIMAPGNDAGLAEVVAEAARIAARKPRRTAKPRDSQGSACGWRPGAER